MDERTEPDFADWIGRRSEARDVVTPRLADSFRAIFTDRLAPVAEGEAPLGLHWCLSPSIAPMYALGSDGHPALNLDLPPVPLPRRMWAGGSLETIAPLRIGDTVRRVTTIGDIRRKQGRSGELWFVGVDHEYVTPRGPAIRERHDIVYREAAAPGDRPAATPQQALQSAPAESGGWIVETTPTLLFRYSAITFNGHRIHYDLPYARDVEGYAGLVVHGPIQATLLFNLAATSLGAPPRRFAYRALSPAIAGNPMRIGRSPDDPNAFVSESADGTVHMRAIVGDDEDRARDPRE